MARQGWGRRTPVSGSDSGDQVSVNAWNADNKTEGLFGFTGKTIASAASVTIPPFSSTVADQPSSLTILSGSTSIDTIATTNTAIYDLLYVITSGSVTLNDTSTNSGNIHLLGNANFDLSTTVPTILIRVGTAWYEYGGSPVTPSSITFAKIQDIASMKVIGRTAASTGITSEVTILDSDTMTGASATTLATSESIKAYVDNTTTAQDLDITDGTTAGSIDLDSESLTFTSGEGIDATVSGQTLTIAGEDATTSNKGVASFAATEFSVSSGAVSVGLINALKIADGSISNTEFKYLNNLSDNVQSQLDGKSLIAGSSSIVTVGILDTGSITSGFGNIDNGSSTITTSAVTATTFTGALSGNADSSTTSTNVTVADESTDTSCNVLFTTAATGALPPKSGTNLTFNSNTGILTATGFAGPLTGNVTGDASGSSASCTGNAATSTSAAGLSTALISTSGGTGVTSYTAGDILYYATGTTLTKLAKPGTPAGEVLTFASGATAPTWAAAAGGAASTLLDFKYQATSYTTPSYTARTVNDANTPIQLWVKDIDTNNQGIYIRIKKNAAYTDVQIG